MIKYKLEDYIGLRFGKLVVVGEDRKLYPSGKITRVFKCVCDCGKTVLPTPWDLINGSTISCGCLRIEKSKERNNLPPEIFLEKAKEKYGDKFDYSQTRYVATREKIIVICREHGEFKILPDSHLRGYGGCPKCKDKYISEANLKTLDTFIKEAKDLHGEDYSYNNAIYTKTTEPITITCKIHGDFSMTPSSHLKGHGCRECFIDRLKITEDEFISRSNQAHNDFYSYEGCGFIGVKKPVTITCPKHGKFSQIAYNHFTGCRCPGCNLEDNVSGFNKNKPAWLYILKAEGAPFTFTGYGITGNLKSRLKRHTQVLRDNGFKIVEQYEIFHESGEIISEVENKMKTHFTVDTRTKTIDGFIKESCMNTFDEVLSFAKDTFNKIKERKYGDN